MATLSTFLVSNAILNLHNCIEQLSKKSNHDPDLMRQIKEHIKGLEQIRKEIKQMKWAKMSPEVIK